MIPVAHINRLFGAEGEVVITLYNTFPEDFTPSTPLFVRVDSLMVPLWCDKFERRGRSSARVIFADVDNNRRVSEFIGTELFAEESTAQESDDSYHDDEFFMEDLIGFKAIIDDMDGEVSDFYDNKNNPLLGITLAGREVLVPAVEEFITHIDFYAKVITFNLPEGLLEL